MDQAPFASLQEDVFIVGSDARDVSDCGLEDAIETDIVDHRIANGHTFDGDMACAPRLVRVDRNSAPRPNLLDCDFHHSGREVELL